MRTNINGPLEEKHRDFLKLEDGANFNKPRMKVVYTLMYLLPIGVTVYITYTNLCWNQDPPPSMMYFYFCLRLEKSSQYSQRVCICWGFPRMPGGVCPSWVIRAVQPTRSSRPRNPRNLMKWCVWFRPLGLLFLFSTCTMNLACCRGHGSAGSARTQVPREWETLGICCTRCMTVSKGIVDVDRQRNIAAGWHSKTWTLQCLCLHPWSTSISNHQFLAAMLQECRRKLWPSSRQSTYQGRSNLAQLTPSPWGSRGFGLMVESWTVQPPATSNHQTPHGARKATLGHHDEGWKGFGKDDLLSRLWCAFTNSWSQQRRSDTQLGVSGTRGCGKSQILDTVSWLFCMGCIQNMHAACLFFPT